MKALITTLLLLISVSASAYPTIKITADRVLNVYDGDTFTVTLSDVPRVFGEKLSIRLAGIDAPEVRSSCWSEQLKEREKEKALKAKEFLAKRLYAADTIELVNPDRDKYFRIVATIKIDGKDIGKEMIRRGLAVPYDGGTKEGWCGK